MAPAMSAAFAPRARARPAACRAKPRAAAGALRLLCCAAALHGAWQFLGSSHLGAPSTAAVLEPALRQPVAPPARRQLLASAIAGATAVGGVDSAHAIDTKKTEVIKVPANGKSGTRGYSFEKPKGFKRFANTLDPSGFLFRNTNDTYFTFVTRAELRENASTTFKPEDFIADYKLKFANTTGSSFEVVKGGGEPNRVDAALGIKYYEVEYVVKTQLGFSFDSLRTLHFLTVFAAGPDSIYILNTQAPDEKWQADGPVLQKIAESFAVV
eukprot:CAMPEP_0197898060 /NCGR_PEP_ID=MMETSP1439-20131203/43117_1 /TAXON_ID=66791 /ORGANISM="Gonyaulax spinifera, Strain CCMP409" /LENGTH=268 /DNA_ID=CAMNT_0043518743 /DNA_START=32 /DNA_END=838 /DNA_ORIENTATION=+